MEETNTSDFEAHQIRKQLEALQKEAPHLSTVIEALQDLFVAQAELKARIPETDFADLAIDQVSYAQGSPILAKTDFSLEVSLFRDAVGSILEAMKKGFPKVAHQLDAIQSGLLREDAVSQEILTALTSGNSTAMDEAAEKLDVDRQILDMAVTQILKPFAQKRSESLPPLPENLQWSKGYCPACGSWPELSFLEGREGFRWLRCSFCGYEWKFLRIQCPFCETDDQSCIEIIFPEDKPYHRAELCSKCKKYIVGMDFRDLAFALPRSIAPLALVHLDVLAQERQYEPAAACLWNTF